MAPFDSSTSTPLPQFFSGADLLLSTPRGRLLYIRDHIIPAIPEDQINMDIIDCGTHACLAGWVWRDDTFRAAAIEACGSEACTAASLFTGLASRTNKILGITTAQSDYLFRPAAYPSGYPAYLQTEGLWPATKAELTAHIDDVLSGRVK